MVLLLTRHKKPLRLGRFRQKTKGHSPEEEAAVEEEDVVREDARLRRRAPPKFNTYPPWN